MNIKVNNLSFTYGDTPVLDRLSFSCHSGQFIAVLGENGSGKSTLLSLLAGFKNSPAIEWDGYSPSHWSLKNRARLRTVVSQNSTFDTTMSLYDCILLGRKPWFEWNETPADHQIVIRMLELFELEQLAFRPLSDISGGERQKALLARAFAQDTPLLLLDEPLNNLDLRFQVKFLNLLRQRSRESAVLTIIILHDINAALNWCDMALLLKAGKLIAQGSTLESINSETVEHMMGVKARFIEESGRRHMLFPLID